MQKVTVNIFVNIPLANSYRTCTLTSTYTHKHTHKHTDSQAHTLTQTHRHATLNMRHHTLREILSLFLVTLIT